MNCEEPYIVNSKCEVLLPSGTDICIDKDDCEKKVNICMECVKTVNISGHVFDCNERPVKNAVVRLFEYEDCNRFKAVCYTFTDCNGFYVINLKGDVEGKYHIMVSECREVKKNSCHGNDCKNYDCNDKGSCRECNDSMYWDEFEEEDSYSYRECKRKECNKCHEQKRENKIDYSNYL